MQKPSVDECTLKERTPDNLADPAQNAVKDEKKEEL
jgi:hypothetical protein